MSSNPQISTPVSRAAASGSAVIGRVLVRGTYTLKTIAHFGSGQSGEAADLTLLKGGDGTFLIPGTSLAGVCRSYLAHYFLGEEAFGYTSPQGRANGTQTPASDKQFRKKEQRAGELPDGSVVDLTALFGTSEFEEEYEDNMEAQVRDDGAQSALIFNDALATTESYTSIRDGVRLDPHTGQVYQKTTPAGVPIGAKYDREVIEPGTSFEIRLELVLRRNAEADKLKACLNLLLDAFKAGEIRLGAKTRRGYGRGEVTDWQVQEFDFHDKPQAVLDWLGRAAPTPGLSRCNTSLDQSFQSKLSYFELKAWFDFPASILVRSYQVAADEVDAVQVRVRARGVNTAGQATDKFKAVLPGTSVAGAVRHRAERIARTLTPSSSRVNLTNQATKMVDRLFGYVEETKSVSRLARQQSQQISRIQFEEEYLPAAELQAAIHTRVSIDRFTGGSRSGFLFEEEPLWPTVTTVGGGGEDRQGWLLDCRIWHPEESEIGLLLLVLKDLWTGDLPLGGEAGIGRGVLKGLKASLRLVKSGTATEWELAANAEASAGLTVTGENLGQFEGYAQALIARLEMSVAARGETL